MKTLLPLFTFYFLLFTFSTAPAQPIPPRPFTDTQGRTIEATILNATETDVTLRRSDGATFTIPINTLSQPDQNHIARWLDDSITKAASLITINVSRFNADSVPTKSSRTDNIGYSISLYNNSAIDIPDLRIEYRLYMTKDNKTKSKIKSIQTPGKFQVPLLVKKTSTENFRTDTQAVKRDLPTGNKTSSSLLKDSSDGIWVRVYRNNAIVKEHLTTETLRETGWSTATPKKR